MGKILDAFLSDQLRVNDVTEQRTPEHQELCERGYELQEILSQKLDDEEKKLLTELVDTLYDRGYIDAQKKFKRGYQLGVLMTMEVFAEQDCFL
ncbi:MAG: hypothetical protein NC417_02325 [Candidatus Gastranaerophilales bacterium]|nr:hypothetical protein [Candidatus Gastranaerophilales bacterium]